MADQPTRRRLLQLVGVSLGFGGLYRFGAGLSSGPEGSRLAAMLGRRNGESPQSFSFVQLSDTHVGFQGPPDPLGTQAFERAVETINALPERPELVLFSGDLTHDSEKDGERADRMRRFRQIAAGLAIPKVYSVPGEHDAALDGGALYRDVFGETFYSFDHRGVHFLAIDNVSRGKPVVGKEQLDWIARDLARFPKSSPIVVFTHRPLFDLRPDWEWFTGDGDAVLNLLAPFDNVTVLYGHIHRHDVRRVGNASHLAARSLVFAFPDPAGKDEKKPLPFDPAQPFRNLGVRRVREASARASVEEIELTLNEHAGVVGAQQFSRQGDVS